MPERKFVGRPFRSPQMRPDDHASSVLQNLLQCGNGCTDTCIVRDNEILIEWNVEIHTHERLFTGEIKRVHCLHSSVYFMNIVESKFS